MTFEVATERVLRFVSFAATFMFVVGVLLTMTDIALRSVSTLTVHGMVDLMQLCVLTGAMLAVPHAFLSDHHVAIDLFVERMPAKVQLTLRIIAALLAIAFLSGVLWFSYLQALNEAHDRSQTIGIPMGWYWTPFLIGIALSVFANVALMVQLWRQGLPTRAVE